MKSLTSTLLDWANGHTCPKPFQKIRINNCQADSSSKHAKEHKEFASERLKHINCTTKNAYTTEIYHIYSHFRSKYILAKFRH